MKDYLAQLDTVLKATTAGDSLGSFSVEAGMRIVTEALISIRYLGQKVMVIGNGGSAAIASHVAIDLTKNAGMSALAFNDGPALTCMANDYGFEEVFAKQVQAHGRSGDMLIAISSSGQSPDILLAAKDAERLGFLNLVTFSGFAPDNPLRRLGRVNFYVPSSHYGFVELTHQIILHALTDGLIEVHNRKFDVVGANVKMTAIS